MAPRKREAENGEEVLEATKRARQENAVDTSGAASEEETELPANGMRKYGLPGQVHKIKLQNFMCHENFEMEFGPHINFISGQNGSGKSAVLQALQVALGVRANQTSRASSLNEFVRKGASDALVAITIWNRGEDAYEHEKYGDFITIERRINSTPAYQAKTASNHKVALKAADLAALLEYLNINASNPVAVMTQDVSRSFLTGSTAKADQKKYEIYMEATLLATISENLINGEGHIADYQQGLDEEKTKYHKLKQERMELQKQVDSLNQMDEWRDDERSLRSALAWCVVRAAQELLDEVEELVRVELPHKLEELAPRLEEARGTCQELQQQLDAKTHIVESFNSKVDVLKAEEEALQQRCKTEKSAVSRQENAVKKVQQKLDDKQKQKESIRDTVVDFQAEVQRETQDEADAHSERLQEEKERHAALKAEADKADAAVKETRARVAELGRQKEEKKRAVDDAYAQVEHIKQQMRQAKEGAANKMSKFGGPAAIALVDAIKKYGSRFNRPPIGPVGAYLALADSERDSMWAKPLEVAVSANLNTFLVSSLHDCRQLQELARSLKVRPPSIEIMSFDTPRHRLPEQRLPPPELTTAMSVVRCTDLEHEAIIMNYMVDAAKVERVVLCRDRDEAERAGYETRNVLAAYTLDGGKRSARGNNQVFEPAPRFVNPRIGADGTAHLQELQALLQNAEAAVQAAKDAHAEVQAQLAQLTKQLSAQSNAHRQHTQATRASASVIDELLSQPVAAAELDAGDAAEGLEKELAEVNEEILQLERQLFAEGEKLEGLRERERRAQAEFAAKRDADRQLHDEYSSVVDNMMADDDALKRAQEVKKYYEEVNEKLGSQLERLSGARDSIAAEKEALHSKALEICTEEEGSEALTAVQSKAAGGPGGADLQKATVVTLPKAISDRLTKLVAKINRCEKEAGGARGEILRQYRAAETVERKVRAKLQTLGKVYQELYEGFRMRRTRLEKTAQHVEEAITCGFHQYMSRKGHSGSIRLDNEKKQLEIKVEIAGSTGKNKGVKDLKQLSGGERSFTTVAFALALGQWTENPFRAMDEFDVFMDAVNRKLAMENLFQNAVKLNHLQFIFLTPQDIAAVEDVKRSMADKGCNLPEGFVRVMQLRPARP